MPTYWTVQSLEKWIKIKELGFLEGDRDNIMDEYYAEYYHWMMKQMSKRLKNYKGEYPIWLWTKRPDLRQRGHIGIGKKGVLLKVEIDEKDVLLSDFMVWHVVLNNGVIFLSDDEERLYDEGKSDLIKEKSWERVFDLELLKSMTDWTDLEQLQGTTGRINIKNIKLIKEFTGR
jgi:hypothetical protein